MKSKGIKVILVLALSLGMVLGSASAVEAGNPHTLEAYIGQTNYSDHIELYVHLNFTAYRAYDIKTEWYRYEFGNGGFVLRGSQIEDLDGLIKSWVGTIIYEDGDLKYSNVGEIWLVKVYLVKKNGMASHKPLVCPIYQIE